MEEDDRTPPKFSELRKKAEEILKQKAGNPVSVSQDEILRVFHDLHVHRIELEMQNEELRRTQDELAASRDEFADLYDTAPVAYFTLDAKGLITRVNLTAAFLFGVGIESVLKKPFSSLVCKDDQDTYYFHSRLVLKAKTKQICVIKLMKKSGEQFPAQLESVATIDENGDPSGLRMVVTDITERKRLEEELKKSHDELEKRVQDRTADLFKADEELTLQVAQRELAQERLGDSQHRLELALAGAELSLWECDVKTGEGILRGKGNEILGYSKSGIESYLCSWDELTHPDDQSQAKRDLDDHLQRRTPFYETELRLRAKSGEWRWVLVRGKVASRDKNDNPVLIAGTLLDITNRKLSEEALKQSEQRFRAIFESAKVYISLKDKSLRYIDVNPAAEKLLKLPVSKIIGRTYGELFGEEDTTYLREVDARVLTGESVEGEHTRKLHGTPMTFLFTKTPLLDAHGDVIGILTMSRDITERKQLEVSCAMSQEYPSKAMRATLKSAILAGKSATTVLLTGESGSGKDHLARYIHDHSDRASGPYFSVNCASISASLAESELFGHERGSFTGAHSKKRGLLELAEGGTLLLNEIGELSLRLQSKLLTFLDTKKFTRVGGEKEVSVNARLIAATNRDLETEVEEGRFRKDLFYRLNVFSIPVPPLRERRDDIPLLIDEILSGLRTELKIHEMPTIDHATMNALKNYGWPGNVRELRNTLERSLILSAGGKINVASLGLSCVEYSPPQEGKGPFSVSFPDGRSLNEITHDLKRFLVDEALRLSGGGRQRAAKLLGISRDSLKHHMKTLGYHEEKE